MAARTIEVEFDTPHNNNISFLPLGLPIRGRFVLSRVAEPTAGQQLDKLGPDIPGQRILLNFDTGEGQVIEPLHFPEHRETKHRLETRLRVQIPEPSKPVKAHIATWAFWLRRYVEEGIATVKSGAWPDKIEGKPVLSRIAREPGGKEEAPVNKEMEALKSANELLLDELRKLNARVEAVEAGNKRKTA